MGALVILHQVFTNDPVLVLQE